MDSTHLDDLDAVLVDALAALGAVVDRDWQVPAAGLGPAARRRATCPSRAARVAPLWRWDSTVR